METIGSQRSGVGLSTKFLHYMKEFAIASRGCLRMSILTPNVPELPLGLVALAGIANRLLLISPNIELLY